MTASAPEQLQRTRWSLDGLSVGDAFGDRIFFASVVPSFTAEMFTSQRSLPAGQWKYTDDTQMALSIIEVLTQYGTIDQDALARSFGNRFERSRGYGSAMYELLPRLKSGHDWRVAAPQLFGGQGSFGNGAAMRVAPLGAFFADDIQMVVEQAARSAQVTHTHQEAIAGTIAVAVAAAVAWNMRQHHDVLQPADFLDLVLSYVPASIVRDRIQHIRTMPMTTSLWKIVLEVGNGSGATAHDTVPFVLWCAAQHLDDFVEAMWFTASGLGDIDTNCAMVGGIVASYTGTEGIPTEWLRRREPLPQWAFAPSPSQ